MRRHDWMSTTLALTVALGLTGCGGGEEHDGSQQANPAVSASTPQGVPTTTSPTGSGTISLTEPVEGSTVDRGFTVKGSGSAFEGTVLWTLTAASGTQPTSGYATVGSTAAK